MNKLIACLCSVLVGQTLCARSQYDRSEDIITGEDTEIARSHKAASHEVEQVSVGEEAAPDEMPELSYTQAFWTEEPQDTVDAQASPDLEKVYYRRDKEGGETASNSPALDPAVIEKVSYELERRKKLTWWDAILSFFGLS